MVHNRDIAIRLGNTQDVAAICAFGETHIRPHYEPLIGSVAAGKQVSDWWSHNVIVRAVGGRAIIIAESSDRLVGVTQVSVQSDPPTIYKLYVHPSWRGRGVGGMLLDAVVQSLPPQTARIAVEHFAANERAGTFYQREGYAIDHVSEDASGNPAMAVVWRVKTLA